MLEQPCSLGDVTWSRSCGVVEGQRRLNERGLEFRSQVEPSDSDGGALTARLARTEAEMAALQARHSALKREEAAAAAARRVSLEMEQCRRQQEEALAQRDLKAARQTQVRVAARGLAS